MQGSNVAKPDDSIVTERRIAAALARVAFADRRVRVASSDLSDCDCIVGCTLGLYGVNRHGLVRKLVHGFFHGVRRCGSDLLVFEICDRPRLANAYGRILRIPVLGSRLGQPQILVEGLDNRCHQLAAFDDRIHLIDTAHQKILRFTLSGVPIDAITPFPYERGVSPQDDYRHLNSIAQVGDRIGVMLHNGGKSRTSELAWFDRQWRLLCCEELSALGCHDIVADTDGTLWHCGSMAGELINSRGEHYKVSERLTRGLAIAPDGFVVGVCTFGTREVRDNFTGTILYLDRNFTLLAEVDVPTAPMDLVLL